MADRDKNARRFEVAGLVGVFGAAQAQAGNALIIADDFVDNVIPNNIDFAVSLFLEQVVLHDLFSPQLVATVNQAHLAGDIAQVKGFFHGCIAAAHDGNVFAAIEETVAGGARRHAPAFVGLL